MIKKLTVDRMEADFAILFDEDGNKYSFKCPLAEGEMLECDIENDGSIRIIRTLSEESLDRKIKNTNRLKALFCRGGKK